MRLGGLLAFGVIAILLAPVVRAEENDAEKLFRGMEKKITTTKALKVVFAYQFDGKAGKGSLLLTDDNRTRLEVSGRLSLWHKRDATVELLSNGKAFKLKGATVAREQLPNARPALQLGGQTDGETPKAFHACHAEQLSRMGIGEMVLGLGILGLERDPDGLEPLWPVYDFRMDASEKTGDRDAKVIRYRCGKGSKDDPYFTLWLDAETGLPSKRIVLEDPQRSKITITESYSEFSLNPEIDAKAFELPK